MLPISFADLATIPSADRKPDLWTDLAPSGVLFESFLQ